MAATAFAATAIFRGARDGRTIHYPLTISDVAAAFALSPDGGDYIQMGSDQPYNLVDFIVTGAGGVDTNNLDVFVNGLQTPLRIVNKSNLATANFRQFLQNPVSFAAGAKIKLKQSA